MILISECEVMFIFISLWYWFWMFIFLVCVFCVHANLSRVHVCTSTRYLNAAVNDIHLKLHGIYWLFLLNCWVLVLQRFSL